MPSALSGNTGTATAGSGNTGGTRSTRSEAGKDFGQMLQGGASAPTTPVSSKPATSTPAPGADAAPQDSTADKAATRPREAEATAGEGSAAPPTAPASADATPHKDKSAPTEEAPWPPLGLAGLVLAVPNLAEPKPLVPAASGDAEAVPLPAATTALPAATVTTAAAASPPSTAAIAAPATDDDAVALPLPELMLGGRSQERADDGDGLLIGDRTTPAPLQAPLPAALQDLKAALASNTVFNGEPTPKPVLGDDGFDQAIGARIGWLADQKIGHAHIRLNPEDLGPVDVRLQMNGDKVHASFSSPHVDVRQALESSLPRLRELLGEQGFQLAHADVGHQHGGERSAGSQSGGSARGGDGEPSLGDSTVSASQLIRQRGLLDAYA